MKSVLYDWGGLNTALFHLVNSVHVVWLDQVMLAGTWLGSHQNFGLFAAVFAIIACARLKAEPLDAASARSWLLTLTVFSVAYVLDGALIALLKTFFDYPRPALALGNGEVNIVGEAELHHSLPSGHASFAMLVAAAIWPRLGTGGRAVAALLVLWVGVSRVYVGAHFPADVVFGYLKTLLLVVAVRRLAAVAFKVQKPAAG